MFGKWIQRGILASLALLTAGLVGSGCTVEQESQLFIRQVLAVVQPDCIARAEPDAPAVGTGILDSALSQEYKAWLLVGNQLVTRGSADQARTETSRISFQSAEVRITSASDGSELSAYTVPINGFADAALNQEPSYGVTNLPLVDRGAIAAIGSIPGRELRRIVATVKVTGRTLGGSTVTSNEFPFVIQVCRGCLVTFGNDDDDPNTPETDCTGPGSTSSTISNNASCITGQDTSISCQACKGKVDECKKPAQ